MNFEEFITKKYRYPGAVIGPINKNRCGYSCAYSEALPSSNGTSGLYLYKVDRKPRDYHSKDKLGSAIHKVVKVKDKKYCFEFAVSASNVSVVRRKEKDIVYTSGTADVYSIGIGQLTYLKSIFIAGEYKELRQWNPMTRKYEGGIEHKLDIKFYKDAKRWFKNKVKGKLVCVIIEAEDRGEYCSYKSQQETINWAKEALGLFNKKPVFRQRHNNFVHPHGNYLETIVWRY